MTGVSRRSVKRMTLSSASDEEFDIAALYDALDQERRKRGLTWAAVTRQINAIFKDVDARPISQSTITGMRSRGSVEGNGIIQMLIWLDRTPESFIPGYNGPQAKLPRVGTDRILRWHTGLIHAALDERRKERGMTWKQIAEELGPGFTAATLTRMKTPGHVGFPSVMRIFAWLGRPAADFARPSRV